MRSFDPTQMTAMLVVSNPHLRKLLTTILNAIGFRDVQTARTAREAIQILAATSCDLVIAANDLSDAPGVRLARAVRVAPNARLRGVPFVLFVETPTRETVAQAQAAQVTTIMTLPTSIKTVAGRLSAIFARRNRLREAS